MYPQKYFVEILTKAITESEVGELKNLYTGERWWADTVLSTVDTQLNFYCY